MDPESKRHFDLIHKAFKKHASNIVEMLDLIDARFTAHEQQINDLERRMLLMQQELDCPERSAT